MSKIAPKYLALWDHMGTLRSNAHICREGAERTPSQSHKATLLLEAEHAEKLADSIHQLLVEAGQIVKGNDNG